VDCSTQAMTARIAHFENRILEACRHHLYIVRAFARVLKGQYLMLPNVMASKM
jgi:hypothetical protein